MSSVAIKNESDAVVTSFQEKKEGMSIDLISVLSSLQSSVALRMFPSTLKGYLMLSGTTQPTFLSKTLRVHMNGHYHCLVNGWLLPAGKDSRPPLLKSPLERQLFWPLGILTTMY